MSPEISHQIPASAAGQRADQENAFQPPAKRGESRPEDGLQLVSDLHAHFCRWSKLELRLRPEFHRLWWDLYVDRGRDAEALRDDIRIVCVYLRSQIERDKRNPGALRLVNLLQPDQFESDVAEARMMRGKGAAKSGDASSHTAPKAPPGWRAWFEDQYPTRAPEYRDRPFSDLPESIQKKCREELGA